MLTKYDREVFDFNSTLVMKDEDMRVVQPDNSRIFHVLREAGRHNYHHIGQYQDRGEAIRVANNTF